MRKLGRRRFRRGLCGRFHRLGCCDIRYVFIAILGGWCCSERLIWNSRYKSETYDSRPITSHILWPSFLVGVLAWPMELMNCTPSIHSSTESSTSRVKSWMCLMRDDKTSLFLGVILGPIVSMTCWVKLGSNLCSAIVASMWCSYLSYRCCIHIRSNDERVWNEGGEREVWEYKYFSSKRWWWPTSKTLSTLGYYLTITRGYYFRQRKSIKADVSASSRYGGEKDMVSFW